MANDNAVRGLIPKYLLGGGTWDSAVRKFHIPSSDGTAMGIGDLVKLTGESDTASGVPDVAQAAAGASTNIHVGAVVGFIPVTGQITPGSENLIRRHRPASTEMYALVVDSPACVYEIQEDAVGGALAAASVGLNSDIIVAAASTVTGHSGMQLDTSTAANTATLPLKIVGFSDRVGNEIAVANAKVLVLVNSHYARTGVLGV
jgi:hypothetical protein